jgi:hypothetical protein
MNFHQQEENNYPKAVMISTGIMLVLLGISYFIILGNPLPQFGTGGIIVNYGTSPEGMGDDYMSIDEPSMDPNANATLPDRVVPNATPEPVASQQSSDKSIVTQDMEDAPAVVTKAEKPNTTPTATPEKKESKPTVNPNALYTGKKNNASGTGDGTGTTPGNQGSKDGDPLASNYGEGGSGFGDASLSLANRRFVVSPKIEDNGQQSGKIAVEVRVDRDGKIISARAGVRGTTISNNELYEKCERAALGAQLNRLDNAPPVQTGVIVFNFKLK